MSTRRWSEMLFSDLLFDSALTCTSAAYRTALVSLGIAVMATFFLCAMVFAHLLRSRRALQQSEARFRATFDQAAVGMAHVGLDGHWLHLNQRYCDLLGYSIDELRKLTFQDVTHPADVEADVALAGRLIAGELSTYSMEKQYIRKDGSLVWVALACSLVRKTNGEPDYFIALATDVSERRAAQDALRHERDFTSAILDTVCALVVVFDREGHIARWNRACERLTGYTFDEVKDVPVWDRLLLPEERAAVMHVFARIVDAQENTRGYENHWVGKDGARHLIAWSSTTLVDDGGRVAHVIGTGIDVTDQRRAEAHRARLYQEAEDAIRLRDEFLSIASHELKTPLTPIGLQVSHILRALRKDPASLPPDKLLPRLETIRRQVERLGSLVTELLDISSITAGRLRLEWEEVDLAAVARDVALRLGYEAARAGCKLDVRAQAPLPGRWDRARLDQIVTNLLSNAIKYGAGKPIDLVVEGDDSTARLLVRDRGIGIAPEHQARIFDRFERAVPDQQYGGFGLGLWIVKQILDALGGTIRVTSAPGSGATFLVELPRRPDQRGQVAA
ncbi:sensor histidine kinase [Polyangium sp. y55x31]|uniref:sensor histidine kinase n=1 Tax=Polyangium sp. y55x31 TaxID=3042688 RepID=UPI0024829155|nr:sensor histidine kinase [Polyangium sp. y55x31]MDI1480788.1 PAS domain S-box protein [Polyangium sp. y55x31]